MTRNSSIAHNVGTADRALRAIAATMLFLAAALAPLSPAVRLLGLGGMGAYLMFTAIAGTCLGYRLMGRSTCPARSSQAHP